MPDTTGSRGYRRILETTSIMAGASVINVLAGLARMKIAAVMLGPAGIGLIGIYQNLVSTAASFAAMGIPTVGAKRIAQTRGADDAAGLVLAKRSLFGLAWLLGIAGAILVWLLRLPIARALTGAPDAAASVGWLSLAVLLTVLAGAQTAYLTGLQRIGEIGRLTVASGLLSTLVVIALLIRLEHEAIVPFVAALPATACVLGTVSILRLPRQPKAPVPLRRLVLEGGALVRLGLGVVVASVGFGLAQLVLRSVVGQRLGTDALGHFQASWAISVVYAGIIFQAMGTDYFPRLTMAAASREELARVVGEQSDALLLLGIPAFLAVLACAPWLVHIAYTQDFGPSIELLRWQVVGDLFKLGAWPLAMINLAAGDARRYLVIETATSLALVAVALLLLPVLGLLATGAAVIAMNAVNLALSWLIAVRRHGVGMSRANASRLGIALGVACILLLVAPHAPGFSMMAGVIAAVAFFAHGVRRLATLTGTAGSLGTVLVRLIRWLARLGRMD